MLKGKTVLLGVTGGIAAYKAAALASARVQEFTNGMTIRKVIVVPGRLVNIVAN